MYLDADLDGVRDPGERNVLTGPDGIKLGRASAADGEPIEIEISMETAPAALWDAMVVGEVSERAYWHARSAEVGEAVAAYLLSVPAANVLLVHERGGSLWEVLARLAAVTPSPAAAAADPGHGA